MSVGQIYLKKLDKKEIGTPEQNEKTCFFQ